MSNSPDNWIRDYILLAFRVDRLFRKQTHSYLVDYYYGPPEWQQAVQAEPESEPVQLVKQAEKLQAYLPGQEFDRERENFLQKQVFALHTLCRKLSGEVFSLAEEVERCLDVRPYWIPEEQFDQALAIYRDILPGKGSLADRYQLWRSRYDFPAEKVHLLMEIIEDLLIETRARCAAFLDLPEGDHVQLAGAHDKRFGAANWYLGNFSSRMEVNLDRPLRLPRLIQLICHELYPGHHTEFVLKEKHLFRGKGYLEQSIFLLMTPQLTITEGIAMQAAAMLFEPGEAESYLVEHIFPKLDVAGDPHTIALLSTADHFLEGISGNAAMMLHAGRPDQEVIQYLMHYTLDSEARISQWFPMLKIPFLEAYTFSYFLGKRLMAPLLKGDNRHHFFQRFLTEPVTPSDLVNPAWSS
ncbi:MAG: hypothetical protein JSV61_08375 [Anaerolineales bacterium]|nr:MAG: hypothetical protein JSV61_08375 [Anaerolineales bacterium]